VPLWLPELIVTVNSGLLVLPLWITAVPVESVPPSTDSGILMEKGAPSDRDSTTCAGPGAARSAVSVLSSWTSRTKGAPGLFSRLRAFSTDSPAKISSGSSARRFRCTARLFSRERLEKTPGGSVAS